uniref:Uncharacterized protein n=1 Tax=Ixodes ricinus TaxID=34613 RepID=A0A6B0VB66_IXORI
MMPVKPYRFPRAVFVSPATWIHLLSSSTRSASSAHVSTVAATNSLRHSVLSKRSFRSLDPCGRVNSSSPDTTPRPRSFSANSRSRSTLVRWCASTRGPPSNNTPRTRSIALFSSGLLSDGNNVVANASGANVDTGSTSGTVTTRSVLPVSEHRAATVAQTRPRGVRCGVATFFFTSEGECGSRVSACVEMPFSASSEYTCPCPSLLLTYCAAVGWSWPRLALPSVPAGRCWSRLDGTRLGLGGGLSSASAFAEAPSELAVLESGRWWSHGRRSIVGLSIGSLPTRMKPLRWWELEPGFEPWTPRSVANAGVCGEWGGRPATNGWCIFCGSCGSGGSCCVLPPGGATTESSELAPWTSMPYRVA